MTQNPLDKYEKLKAIISVLGGSSNAVPGGMSNAVPGGMAVAFSGGTDSTLLLKAAHEVLGERVLAVTAKFSAIPEREHAEAAEFCKREKIRQIVFETSMDEIEGFRDNTKKRCYYCKRHILSKIWRIARENGFGCVADGSNADDGGDFRPGFQAVRELGVESPLLRAGLTKPDIRAISDMLKLPTWDKQSFSCLANRIPYGERISDEKIEAVDKAESILAGFGLGVYRVRCHGDLARIETDEPGFAILTRRKTREQTYDEFKKIGFKYAAIDLIGYRTGSMNE